MYEKAGVQYFILSSIASDHSPLLFRLVTDRSNHFKPFRFFAIWLRDERCQGIVENVWKTKFQGNASFQLARRIEVTSRALKKWNTDFFGNYQSKILELQKKLEEI